MSRAPRICDFVHAPSKDIDPNAHYDAAPVDAIVRRCALATTETLTKPSGEHSGYAREHMSMAIDSMRATHFAIRNLIAHMYEKPASVDALALARLQLEGLFSLCLMVEKESYVQHYLKSQWKRLYMTFLLEREERRGLERFHEYLNTLGPTGLDQLRKLAGVSDAERLTIEMEQLGISLPKGVPPTKIPAFPTPGRVVALIQNQSRRGMLGRLYFEYQQLCAFAHGSPDANFAKKMVDDRWQFKGLFSPRQASDSYSQNVAERAITCSLIGLVQTATEICAGLYPGEVELRAELARAWNVVSEIHILGRVLWEIRSRDALGGLGAE